MSYAPRFALEPGSRVGIAYWSDIHPATVLAISRTGHRVTVRRDRAVRDTTWTPVFAAGGFAAHCTNQDQQRWHITEDPDGPVSTFSLRHDGQWWSNGSRTGQGSRLVEGWRHFHDFNF